MRQILSAGHFRNGAEGAVMRAAVSRDDKAHGQAQLFEMVLIAVPGNQIVAGRDIIQEIRPAEPPRRKNQRLSRRCAGDARNGVRLCLRGQRLDQLGEAFFPQPDYQVINLRTVEVRRIVCGMAAADHHHGPALHADFRRLADDRVGLARKRGKADDIRAEIFEHFPEIFRRFAFAVKNQNIVSGKRPGQNFQVERLPLEKLFERCDSVLLFRNAAAAVGRIDKQNLHFLYTRHSFIFFRGFINGFSRNEGSGRGRSGWRCTADNRFYKSIWKNIASQAGKLSFLTTRKEKQNDCASFVKNSRKRNFGNSYHTFRPQAIQESAGRLLADVRLDNYRSQPYIRAKESPQCPGQIM
jgi:hypothetical protein